MLRPFIVISLLSGATGALADPMPIAGDGLKEMLAGAVVELDTPLGTKLPIRFGTDGLVSAEAGELAPLLGSAKDRGRWWVDGDKLCSKWFRWFDAEVRCITVAQDGTRLHWRKEDGETGTATLVGRPSPKPMPEAPAERPPAPQAVAEEAGPDPIPPPVRKKLAAATEIPAAAPPADANADVPPVPLQTAEATVVASAAEPAAEEDLDTGTMMRFGGAGLLEASARVSQDAPAAPPQEARAPVPAPDAAVAAPAEKKTVAALPPPAKKAKPAPAKASPTGSGGRKQQAPAADSMTSSTQAAAFYRVQGVPRYDVLNVRTGPSDQHVSVAAIPATGRRVEITGACQQQWCPIRYGRVRGWVNRYYLAEESARQNSASQVYLAKP